MIVVAIAALAGQMVFAEGVGITAKAGTLGLGADLTVGLGEKVNARAGINALSYEFDVGGGDDDSESSEEIQSELDWQSIMAVLDWHPWGGGFRLSAGVVFNNNEVLLSADVNESIEIGDREYTVSDLTGKVTFDDVVGYVGIGCGNAVSENGHWHFAWDLGVMFQGVPEVTIEATASDPALQNMLNADIEQETGDWEDDLEAFDMFPVLSFGVSYKF